MPTRFSLRALMALAMLVAALSFVACGGDEDSGMSKEEFKTEAQKISDETDKAFKSALPAATSEDPEESLAGVNQMKSTAGESATKLDALEPPGEFEDVHHKLVGALQTMETRGEAVDQAAKEKDEAKITSAVEAFQQSIRELETAGNEFDKVVGTT